MTQILDTINFLNINQIDILLVEKLLNIAGYENDSQLKSILLLLISNKNNGSSCLNLSNKSFYEKMSMLNQDFRLNIFLNKIKNGEYDKLISNNPTDFKPIIYDYINNQHLLYFHKYYKSEKRLKEIFSTMFKKNININEIPIEWVKNLKMIINQEYNKVQLSDYQKIAVILSIINNLTIISGGAGSGKTTTIIIILLALLKIGYSYEELALAAPTGKASNMLKETIISFNERNLTNIEIEKITISTIHRLLKYSPSKNIFIYNENNKLPYKVLIIDEVSMIDLVLMTKLLKSVSEDAKIILIGDKDQLPPVDVGNVLSSFIIEENMVYFTNECINFLKNNFEIKAILPEGEKITSNRIVILKGNNRAKKEKIKQISISINNQESNVSNLFIKKRIVENNLFFKEENVLLVPSNNIKNDIEYLTKKWLIEYYFLTKLENYYFYELIKEVWNFSFTDAKINFFLSKIFLFLNFAKILTILKDGITGCNYINNLCYKWLNELKIKYHINGHLTGVPIIITENDYINELFNGDIGIILENKYNQKQIFFKIPNGYKSYDFNLIKKYDIAFAMTVHKSQGSGYNNIFFILPENLNNNLLMKETVYTGITRAIDTITLYSKEDILNITVKRKIERETGFYFY
ncbi:MAG: exodeoxyribonuclease V subunit alpha [bacterium]|nr:exodeoxyribonuclease V subunit alpha [bacterium]